MDVPSAADVAARARRLGCDATAAQAESLALYLGLLMHWNARMNLTGAHTWELALDDLAADSFHLAGFLAGLQSCGLLPAEPLALDLGAGAGLPGIPLRIVWQAGEYHMIEPREKRALFLGVALARLGLPRTFALRARAEEVPATLCGADLVVSRAFMPWRDYLAVAQGLLAPGGVCVVMAGEPAPDVAELPEGWRLAGEMAYDAVLGGKGQRRYFWSFTPEAISR